METNRNYQLQEFIFSTSLTSPQLPFIMTSHPEKEKYKVKLMSLGYRVIILQGYGKCLLGLLRESCLMYFPNMVGICCFFDPVSTPPFDLHWNKDRVGFPWWRSG